MQSQSSPMAESSLADAERLLSEKCYTLQQELNELQEKVRQLNLENKIPSSGNPLKDINHEKERMLMAQVQAYQEKPVSVLPRDPALEDIVLKQEMEVTNSQLEETLKFIEAQHDEMVAKIESEKKTNLQLTQIQSSLQEKLKQLHESSSAPDTNSGEAAELIKHEKILSAEYKRMMKEMASFINKHFPPPTRETLDSDERFVPLQTLTENLMNNCIHSPHDPYLTLTPQHWPPYVELLLRCGIALRHPDNANKIRMTPFHL